MSNNINGKRTPNRSSGAASRTDEGVQSVKNKEKKKKKYIYIYKNIYI
jgi:hypothetical protein